MLKKNSKLKSNLKNRTSKKKPQNLTKIKTKRDLSLKDVDQALAKFSSYRNWGEFHSPKNLAMAVGSEVGELLAPFRWLSEKESYDVKGKVLENVKDELGDVLICLMNLARSLDIDLLDVTMQKIEKNKLKYPVV